MLLKSFCVLLLFSLAGNCEDKRNSVSSTAIGEIPFEVIASGTQSNYVEGAEMVITSQQKLEDVLKNINATKSPKTELPTVDFAKEIVFFWSSEQLSYGGPVPEIDRVEKTDSEIIVHKKKIAQDPNQPATMVLSTPFFMVKFEKYNLPVALQ